MYYTNTFIQAYKNNDKAMQDIIDKLTGNCKPYGEIPIIYYNNPGTASLVMKTKFLPLTNKSVLM